MGNIMHRRLGDKPPVAVSAQGMLVRDSGGNTYIDACGGAAVSTLGHGHPDILSAIHRQIDRNACAHSAFFTTDVAEELSERLIAGAPAGLNQVYLVSGGSEAMEAALKLARQFFVAAGATERTTFIARRGSYHGNTLGALAVGDSAWGRSQFDPLLMNVARVAPCYEYRERADGQTRDDYTMALLQEIEATLLATGAEKVIAFCAEPVVGATGGAIAPTNGYFRGVRALCDKYGILLIADEVMCGMGRTGTMHALEQDGVTPDIAVIGNGLGAGYLPIGAVLARGTLVERMRKGAAVFQHGHVYTGHPVAAAAALAVQKVIERDDLLAAVRLRGESLRRMLRDAFGSHEHVGDIRGRGLFMALELVRERSTRQPFDPALKLHAAIKAQAMANGLMVFPGGGTIDGVHGDHVLIAPPFIATDADLSEIVSRLSDAVEAALVYGAQQAVRVGGFEVLPAFCRI